MKKIFVVMRNSDMTEGRGFEYPYYFCTSYEVAEELAKNGGVMGASDASIEERWLVSSKKEQELVNSFPFIKEKALKKLTDEEKIALGIK